MYILSFHGSGIIDQGKKPGSCIKKAIKFLCREMLGSYLCNREKIYRERSLLNNIKPSKNKVSLSPDINQQWGIIQSALFKGDFGEKSKEVFDVLNSVRSSWSLSKKVFQSNFIGNDELILFKTGDVPRRAKNMPIEQFNEVVKEVLRRLNLATDDNTVCLPQGTVGLISDASDKDHLKIRYEDPECTPPYKEESFHIAKWLN